MPILMFASWAKRVNLSASQATLSAIARAGPIKVEGKSLARNTAVFRSKAINIFYVIGVVVVGIVVAGYLGVHL